MRRKVSLAVLIMSLAIGSSSAFAADEPPAAWWKFDEDTGQTTPDSISGISDAVNGSFEYVGGVTARALDFDGYTTFVTRKADKAPRMVDAFTIEAWIAPQTYSWSWTGIVDQAGDIAVSNPGSEGMQLKPGLFGVKFTDSSFRRAEGTDTLTKIDIAGSGGANDWAARWRGYIIGPATGEITFTAEADNSMKLEIDGQTVIDGRGKSLAGKMNMEQGKKYPVVLSYSHDGGETFLRLYWGWSGKEKEAVQGDALKHSDSDREYVERKELNRQGLPPERDDRVSFGIDDEGHIGIRLMIDGQPNHCISTAAVPLLKWSHVAATFDKDSGVNLYINGRNAGSLAVKGVVTPETGYDLYIGRSRKKMSPTHTERGPSKSQLSYMIFDGLIDEVKIYGRSLTADEVGKAYSAVAPSKAQPLQYRVMPSGPVFEKPEFGAAYGRLEYAKEWEKLWRAGPDPDILVMFDMSPVRMVFWRGTGYGAAWVSEKGLWMGDQSLEATGNSTGYGCSEHMSDKQCRYSHVKLIENSDARVVVHWHYAVSDILYNISRTNKDGWGEWADEYYYIYPDAVSTRKQILHSTVLKHEWQETIVLHQPGTRPEDNIDMDALIWGNMDGESKTYTWKKGDRDDTKLRDAVIQMVNLKSQYKPFIIFEPDNGLKLMRCCVEEQWTRFPWWNHWPVAQLPNDGRRTGIPDRPAHSSLSQSIEDSPIIRHDAEKRTYTAVSLYGMTNVSVPKLAPLARSWNYPAELGVSGNAFTSQGYDRYQRAYVLTCTRKDKPSKLECKLAASEKSPVVNPAFVIKNWGDAAVTLKINGREVKRGRSFRYGYNHTFEGNDLVVWVEKQSTSPMAILLSPKTK